MTVDQRKSKTLIIEKCFFNTPSDKIQLRSVLPKNRIDHKTLVYCSFFNNIIFEIFNLFCLVKSEKLRFKAVIGLSTIFDIDIPVQNSQRHNALVAVRWQV
jgi:hypothetical protein